MTLVSMLNSVWQAVTVQVLISYKCMLKFVLSATYTASLSIASVEAMSCKLVVTKVASFVALLPVLTGCHFLVIYVFNCITE